MIRTELRDNVFYILLNGEKSENRLTFDKLNKILNILKVAEKDKNVDIIVIKSELNYFSKGAPIKELLKYSETEAKIYSKLGQSIVKKIRDIKKPVIACVEGEALGGSFEIVLACDLILATKDARFGFNEVNFGIIPGFGGFMLVAKKVHETLSKYLIFTGENVSVSELMRFGIFADVYEDSAALENGLTKTLGKIKDKSMFAIGLSKETINNGLEMSFEQALLLEQNAFTVAFSSNDKKEGMTAFIEKRSPSFKDRWEDFEELN